jgi:hypothetical protein
MYECDVLFTHSWSWALLEKLPIVQLLENCAAFYGTRRFITAFTRALHRSLSWARSIQSIPSHPTSLRCDVLLVNKNVTFSRIPSARCYQLKIVPSSPGVEIIIHPWPKQVFNYRSFARIHHPSSWWALHSERKGPFDKMFLGQFISKRLTSTHIHRVSLKESWCFRRKYSLSKRHTTKLITAYK